MLKVGFDWPNTKYHDDVSSVKMPAQYVKSDYVMVLLGIQLLSGQTAAYTGLSF